MNNKEKKRKRESRGKRMPPRRPVWNIWQGLFLLLFIYIVELPLGWLRVPENLDKLEHFFRFLGVGLGEALLYLIVVLTFFRLIRRPLKELGLVPTKPSYLLLGFVTGIFLFFAVGLLGTLLANWLGTPSPQSFTLAVMGVEHTWQFILLLILSSVIAPIKEEIFFRGVIYPPLRLDYGRVKGILFTAGMFALLHMDLIRFLPLLVGGIVLTWLYEKTSSIYPSMIAHGTWNFIMALAVWIQR